MNDQMKAIQWVKSVKSALGRGVFPHEISFFLELPWRKITLSPQNLVSRLHLAPASRVLEVGAGSGFYSVEIARRIPDGHLEVLDLQPEMLKKAQQKLEAQGLSNVSYTLADARQLTFAEGTFDVLVLVTVLGEVADQPAFLHEARRVLKPQGILSVSEHLPDPDFSSFAKVKTLVEREGFAFFEHYGKRWSYTANFKK
jgi:ubiquinone/menaquinone biosynthesis C-methylase UbiE